MSSISLLLHAVHQNVHVFGMKHTFSEPKIYTGGVNASQWSKLTKANQKNALVKDWYIYFNYRNPKTGKLERQTNIKAGANRYKTKRERLSHLKILQRNLLKLLEMGFDPYSENSKLKQKLFGQEIIEKPKDIPKIAEKPIQSIENELNTTTVTQALELGLKTKLKVLNDNSYGKFKSRINIFKKWLKEKNLLNEPINVLDKKVIINYLNHVLQKSSARNRNNTRTDLGSLFQTLEDNEVILINFIKKINILKTVPTRNKTYTPTQQKDIENYLIENDSLLLLFIQFISYNFLRPIEVCRLRIKDIDINDKKLYVRTKTKPEKIKIIPKILLEKLPDLSNINPNYFLFTPYGLCMEWIVPETQKRNYFTKRFKKIKQHFKLGNEYGLYSFRHTFITKLYRKLRKESTPFETKSKLLSITGHSTMVSLEKYLRDIDAELPEDYSHFFE